MGWPRRHLNWSPAQPATEAGMVRGRWVAASTRTHAVAPVDSTVSQVVGRTAIASRQSIDQYKTSISYLSHSTRALPRSVKVTASMFQSGWLIRVSRRLPSRAFCSQSESDRSPRPEVRATLISMVVVLRSRS